MPANTQKHEGPPPPGPEATAREQMIHRTATEAGKALYKPRKETVEPVFGIIKSAMGFRQFLLRGKAQVGLEWSLVTVAYNNVAPAPPGGARPHGNTEMLSAIGC